MLQCQKQLSKKRGAEAARKAEALHERTWGAPQFASSFSTMLTSLEQASKAAPLGAPVS